VPDDASTASITTFSTRERPNTDGTDPVAWSTSCPHADDETSNTDEERA
jgi:hypothetical protein